MSTLRRKGSILKTFFDAEIKNPDSVFNSLEKETTDRRNVSYRSGRKGGDMERRDVMFGTGEEGREGIWRGET
jgi:hypothetical protein